MKEKIILASASPRRSELLAAAGIGFEVVPSGAEEIKRARSPRALVRENALLKAREVASRPECAGRTVLGADTVVALGRRVLGKPRDAEDAKSMLHALSGRTHRVITGYAVIYPDGSHFSGDRVTRVRFRDLGGDEIDSYVATGEPMDKAGAYAVQGLGAKLVESVEGDLNNVIGLPTDDVRRALNL